MNTGDSDYAEEIKSMTLQQLRAVHRATLFRPFAVHVEDGRSFPVPHPDFLFMTPTGRTVIICQADEEIGILDLLLMTEIEMLPAV